MARALLSISLRAGSGRVHVVYCARGNKRPRLSKNGRSSVRALLQPRHPDLRFETPGENSKPQDNLSALTLCAHRRNIRPCSAEGELQLPFPGARPIGLSRRKLPTLGSFECSARKILAWPGRFERRLGHVARGIDFDFHSNLDLALNRGARARRNLRHHPLHNSALVVRAGNVVF